MPQLRKDPIVGRWVIIATERAKRPKDFKVVDSSPPETECHFCRGNEKFTPPEIFSIKDEQGNWRVRVIPSKRPFLDMENHFWKKGKGPYDLMHGMGRHEVVVETPEHIGNMADLEVSYIRDVFYTYCVRMREIEHNEHIKYVLAFKNYGWDAGGGRIKHSRSQLIATPVNLKRVKEELQGAKFYFNYHERCIFCDMINQELQQKERLVLEKDGFVAIVPFAPRFPFEVWILPKKHTSAFCRIGEQELYPLANIVKTILYRIKKLLNDPPYNYVLHTAPFKRPHAGYWSTIEEDYHWHIEITPRLTEVAGFEWGTGFYICPSLPEESANFLREEV
ncbi:MAG: galactose-1-phosphate uridylyltransferase [Candidatus Omnitrophica bacterium]|nr:galactose-1-phosphate uridylyltransferase [Candidatus Omnitrophota bacterium]